MQFNGITPENNYSQTCLFFNPVEGNFTADKSKNQYIYNNLQSRTMSQLLSSKVEQSSSIEMSRNERQELLNKMMQYFQLHLDSFKTSKSLDILSEVFK